ncbi:MAG: S8 family serine peptidase [Saprospiraceae bacterium]|nr:S8 family serine peptidase [Saprospiraceae bacterium]
MKFFIILIGFQFSMTLCSHTYGQTADGDQTSMQSSQVLRFPKPKHCGIEAALLVRELELGVSHARLREKYRMYPQDGRSYVPAIVAVRAGFDRSKLHRFDVRINSDLGKILTIHIPSEQYKAFIELPGIEYVEIAKPIYPKLDRALEACNVTQVHAGQNLSQPFTGQDVVIGILDIGFDYTHPTFYSLETNELKIKKVWEQNFSRRAPPAGYTYGQELETEEVILAEGADVAFDGHGTRVAGIAAGTGGELASEYRGVASASDVVMVSLNMGAELDGLNTGVIDGINYVFQYAESVGKPAVVNLSQGHHTGPHDGTSLTDQAIDALSGPGRVVVGAVGNEGDVSGFYLHFDHTFANEPEILSYLVWPDEVSAGRTLVDIWGEVGVDFEVGIEIFNPSSNMAEGTGVMLSSQNPISILSGIIVDLEGDTLTYEGGIEINPINGRAHAQFSIDNTAQSRGNNVDLENLLDNDFVQFRFRADRGTVHAYAANNNGEAFFTDLSGVGALEFIDGVRVIGGNPSSTMGELGGTAHSIISVGAYTSKNTFVNTLGETLSTEEIIGAKYFRTSQGPTLDGRIKPDISAPGGLIASAQSSYYQAFDESFRVDSIAKEDDGSWPFSVGRGTSSAAPLVAGIVALMLQNNPELTPSDVKDLLEINAVEDEFTGDLPNQIWGYGKVDAAAVMTSLDQPTSTESGISSKQIRVFPNPTQGMFSIASELPGDLELAIVTPAGRMIFERELVQGASWIVDLPRLAPGIYFLRLKQENQLIQRKIVFVD